MKRFIFIIIVSLIGLIGYGQNINVPVSDSGYYYGVVNDSSMNKYIFMSFLSNGGDNVLHIVPYIIEDGTDSTFMHSNYIESLEKDESAGLITPRDRPENKASIPILPAI